MPDEELMEAGPAVDALIAERFGFPLEPPCYRFHETDEAGYDAVDDAYYGWCYTCCRTISEAPLVARRYSTEIAAAWEIAGAPIVAEHHIEVGRAFNLDGQPDGWFARIANARTCYAETAPLAICTAALAATEPPA